MVSAPDLGEDGAVTGPRSARSPHAVGAAELARRDPVMARLVERHGPMRIGARPPVRDRFERLARAIAYQQLAGAAAAAIWGRVLALTGDAPFAPAAILALDDAELRGAGLSGAKVAALRDLARQVDTGAVRLDRLGRLDDEQVVAELTQVRGIGPWSAHMVLLFDLHRPDVWPTGDLGVRSGYGLAYGLAEPPTPAELAELGEAFRPYRSVAAWYCWRAADAKVSGRA